MRDRLRESLQLLNRASHSVTDLLSRAMPFIWGVKKDTGNKDRSFNTKAMHICPFEIPLRHVWMSWEAILLKIGARLKPQVHNTGETSPEHESIWGLRCVPLRCGVETVRNLGQHISVLRTLTLQSAHFHHSGLDLRGSFFFFFTQSKLLKSKVRFIIK